MFNEQTTTHEQTATRSDFRRLARVRRLEDPQPGFAGPGHTAVHVVGAEDLDAIDPFVLLMDDRADVPADQHLGGAHPHAGFEIATLILEGSLLDRDEGELRAGDVGFTTAGRGVIHGEDVRVPSGHARILQLWFTLPEKDRAAPPRFTIVRGDDVPVYRAPGVEARLYSGSTNGLRSPTQTYVPLTLLDVRLERGASFEQELPASYNGFLLPVAGSVRVEGQRLSEGFVGWLDRRDDAITRLRIATDADVTRVLLFAGKRQNEPTFQRGPFVAGSPEALLKMYTDFRAGRFTPLSQLK